MNEDTFWVEKFSVISNPFQGNCFRSLIVLNNLIRKFWEYFMVNKCNLKIDKIANIYFNYFKKIEKALRLLEIIIKKQFRFQSYHFFIIFFFFYKLKDNSTFVYCSKYFLQDQWKWLKNKVKPLQFTASLRPILEMERKVFFLKVFNNERTYYYFGIMKETHFSQQMRTHTLDQQK